MQHHEPSLNKSTDTDWQILGELELPVGSNLDESIETRLREILYPLNLPADFLNKILNSAQDATERIVHSEVAEREFDRIHLCVFTPNDRIFKRQNWGFFRIEKIERATTDKNFPNHAIEFYLYLEEQ